jgi:hypothetical protein
MCIFQSVRTLYIICINENSNSDTITYSPIVTNLTKKRYEIHHCGSEFCHLIYKREKNRSEALIINYYDGGDAWNVRQGGYISKKNWKQFFDIFIV